MKITQEFTVAQPLPSVWAFFRNVPEVATCLPGAQYMGSPAEGRHAGRVTSKIGPFQASFEGEAVIVVQVAIPTPSIKRMPRLGFDAGSIFVVGRRSHRRQCQQIIACPPDVRDSPTDRG